MLRAALLPALAGLIFVGCSGDSRPSAPDTCQYALDGECDEPEFCAEGTDTTDCGDDSCQYSNDGECDEPEFCALGTDSTDCRIARLCEPQCGARVCGLDPVCSKSCGTCPADFSCNIDGQCVDNRCQPDCGARVCGGDPVCGMSCGTCTGELVCTSEGQCIDTSCQPQCGDRQCGLDPVCGESCGTCEAGESCTDQGFCQPPCSFPRIIQDSQFDRDVTVVTVSGQVTVNGATMRDDSILDNDDRGLLMFTDESTGSTVQAPIGEMGAATYQIPLFAGTYTVRFSAGSRYDQDVLPPSQVTLLAEGVAIGASGALNYDLKTVTVSGQVTMNGAQMPDDTILDNDDRAVVVFTDKQTGSSVQAPVGESGAATYQTALFAGTFDVDVQCGSRYDQDVLPPGQVVRVAEAMPLIASGGLNFDLPIIEVTGEVTVNGGTMPDDSILDNDDRGQVSFRYESTGSEVWAEVGEMGPGIYRTRLVAGAYQIDFQSGSRYDQDVLPASARTRLNARIELTASGSLGFDLGVLNVSGQVTVNGGAMANDTILDNDDRGQVVFLEKETGSSLAIPFGETGAAVYQSPIFAGQYDVEVLSGSRYDQDVLPPSVSTQVQTDLMLSASGALNFDVSVVTVSGRVGLNGGQMPNDTILDNDDRAAVLFRDTSTGQTVSVGVGEMGAAIYQTPLFAGRYEILLNAGSRYDQDVLPPSQTTRLSGGQDLFASGNLDFDVKTHRLFGQITVNGAPMRDDTILDNDDRGSLSLVDNETNSTSTVLLGESGPARYDVRVFEGSYNLYLEAGSRYDQDVLPPSQRILLEVGCP